MGARTLACQTILLVISFILNKVANFFMTANMDSAVKEILITVSNVWNNKQWRQSTEHIYRLTLLD